MLNYPSIYDELNPKYWGDREILEEYGTTPQKIVEKIEENTEWITVVKKTRNTTNKKEINKEVINTKKINSHHIKKINSQSNLKKSNSYPKFQKSNSNFNSKINIRKSHSNQNLKFNKNQSNQNLCKLNNLDKHIEKKITKISKTTNTQKALNITKSFKNIDQNINANCISNNDQKTTNIKQIANILTDQKCIISKDLKKISNNDKNLDNKEIIEAPEINSKNLIPSKELSNDKKTVVYSEINSEKQILSKEVANNEETVDVSVTNSEKQILSKDFSNNKEIDILEINNKEQTISKEIVKTTKIVSKKISSTVKKKVSGNQIKPKNSKNTKKKYLELSGIIQNIISNDCGFIKSTNNKTENSIYMFLETKGFKIGDKVVFKIKNNINKINNQRFQKAYSTKLQ